MWEGARARSHTPTVSRVAWKHAAREGFGVIEYEPHGEAAAEIEALYSELSIIESREYPLENEATH